MMRKSGYAVFFLTALFPGQPADAADRRSEPDKLTIMTFNALFLWDGVEPEEGIATFPWKRSPEAALRHMADIAAVIKRHDPDIINLVEVENLRALTMLNDRFLKQKCYEPYLVQGRDTITGQDVGLLTRIDPESIARCDLKGESGPITKGVSKNYVAVIPIGERRIAFIGVHLLAQPTARRRLHKRQAQAEAIRRAAVAQTEAGLPVIVWGDLNDYDNADRDHINSKPISNVLRRIRMMSEETPDDDLLNVISLLPQTRRYTAHWDKDEDGVVDGPAELTGIDHVLVSPELMPHITCVEIDQQHDLTTVSDHFPVIVRFQFE